MLSDSLKPITPLSLGVQADPVKLFPADAESRAGNNMWQISIGVGDIIVSDADYRSGYVKQQLDQLRIKDVLLMLIGKGNIESSQEVG